MNDDFIILDQILADLIQTYKDWYTDNYFQSEGAVTVVGGGVDSGADAGAVSEAVSITVSIKVGSSVGTGSVVGAGVASTVGRGAGEDVGTAVGDTVVDGGEVGAVEGEGSGIPVSWLISSWICSGSSSTNGLVSPLAAASSICSIISSSFWTISSSVGSTEVIASSIITSTSSVIV